MSVEFDLSPYTQDFVNQFDIRTEGFVNFFNLIPVDRGMNLKGTRAVVQLASDMTHEAGTNVSQSSVRLEEVDIAELDFEATEVEVSYQDIQKWGRDTAIDRKDNELFFEVSDHIEDRLVTNLENFAEAGLAADTYQQALARAKAGVRKVRGFKGAQVIAFVNTDDYYEYLGEAPVATAQNLFGMDYVENFLGYAQIFMSSKIPQGTIFATGLGNLNLAHIPSGGAAYSSIQLTPTENGLVAAKHYLEDKTGDIVTQIHFGLDAFPERVDAVVDVTLGGGDDAGDQEVEA